jgi:hypothetical protein
VLARSLWHAYLDLDGIVVDDRAPGRDSSKLRTTKLALARVDERELDFTLTSIGNDDVAGIVAHQIGRAYAALCRRAGAPFREASAGELPCSRTGSLATVAIGLGVVAANAAHHERSTGEIVGYTAKSEHQIAQAGGLDVDDLALLLAIQATVRDDVLAALDTLRPLQARLVREWRDVLDDREAELRALLGIADEPDADAPARAAQPRTAIARGDIDEANMGKRNFGRPVFKYPEHHGWGRMVLGLLAGGALGVGAAAATGSMAALISPIPVVGLAGFSRGKRKLSWRCASCGCTEPRDVLVCKLCGGAFAGEIRHFSERLDAEERLGNANDIALAAEAEAAKPESGTHVGARRR